MYHDWMQVPQQIQIRRVELINAGRRTGGESVVKRIDSVAVIGSGTVGYGIARQLAAAGVPCLLLGDVSNTIDSDLVTVGTVEDNLPWLGECDWVLEVLPDSIATKRAVLKQISLHIRPGTIVTSNTSSLSINSIIAGMPLNFRTCYMGTHFFVPVNHMKLLELIPGQDTSAEVISIIADFGERVLGKEIIYAKDTPAFVADRLGNFAGPLAMKLMREIGLKVEEVDALTGSVIGRPRTGIFGLYDLVGLDAAVSAAEEVKHNLKNLEEREVYTLPDFCQRMVSMGMLGNKSNGGFYKTFGEERMVIDLDTFSYRPLKKVEFPSLDKANRAQNLAERIAIFFDGHDNASRFVWKFLTGQLLFAASKIPEISDDILNIDRGMRWGYNHERGPFELWNDLDLPRYAERMEAEGQVLPAWIKEMLADGIKSFYTSEEGVNYFYSIPEKKYRPIGSQR